MKQFDGIVLYEFANRPEPATAPVVPQHSTRPTDSATVPPPR
jgi:hypothetical protein